MLGRNKERAAIDAPPNDGQCAAFGCPLFGTVSESTQGDSRWYCFAHFAKPVGMNDRITASLKSDVFGAITAATKEIRRTYGRKEWATAYRGIQQSFLRIERNDLLFGEADSSQHKPGSPSVRLWLARLERCLINATSGSSTPQNAPVVAKIVGPTHVGGYMPNIETEEV